MQKLGDFDSFQLGDVHLCVVFFTGSTILPHHGKMWAKEGLDLVPRHAGILWCTWAKLQCCWYSRVGLFFLTLLTPPEVDSPP